MNYNPAYFLKKILHGLALVTLMIGLSGCIFNFTDVTISTGKITADDLQAKIKHLRVKVKNHSRLIAKLDQAQTFLDNYTASSKEALKHQADGKAAEKFVGLWNIYHTYKQYPSLTPNVTPDMAAEWKKEIDASSFKNSKEAIAKGKISQQKANEAAQKAEEHFKKALEAVTYVQNTVDGWQQSSGEENNNDSSDSGGGETSDDE